MTGTNFRKFSIHKNVRGITLVELIVVLIILAIFAAAGIGAASGYAKRSIIEQNQRNAETMYQATQSALQQLHKGNGLKKTNSEFVMTEEDFVKSLMAAGEAYSFDSKSSNMSADMSANSAKFADFYTDNNEVFSQFESNYSGPNASVHMRYVLTYSCNKTSSASSKLLKELIKPFFADNTVFQGIFTIEFDVEKSADAYGDIHYSAKCLSVFFDSRPKSANIYKPGENDKDWVEAAYQGSDVKVPCRDSQYRNTKSLIGYFDGYKGAALDSVYLPKVQEGIVVKKFGADYETIIVTPEVTTPPDPPEDTTTPTPTPIEEKHTRLIWAATLDKSNLVGSGKDVYYRIELLEDDKVTKILYVNEDFLTEDDQIDGSKHAYNFFTEFESGSETVFGKQVTTDTYTAVYSENTRTTVTKKSIDVLARVYVTTPEEDNYRSMNKDQIFNKCKLMPLRISYIVGEYDFKTDTDHPDKLPYIEYSLDLTGGGESTVLEDENMAVITVYPNYFNNSSDVMRGTNDETGIIAFKKGKGVVIEHEETTPDDTSQQTP